MRPGRADGRVDPDAPGAWLLAGGRTLGGGVLTRDGGAPDGGLFESPPDATDHPGRLTSSFTSRSSTSMSTVARIVARVARGVARVRGGRGVERVLSGVGGWAVVAVGAVGRVGRRVAAARRLRRRRVEVADRGVR